MPMADSELVFGGGNHPSGSTGPILHARRTELEILAADAG
jgi:hypothetical protein